MIILEQIAQEKQLLAKLQAENRTDGIANSLQKRIQQEINKLESIHEREKQRHKSYEHSNSD